MSNAGGMSTITRYTDMLAGNTTWNPWEPDGAYDSLANITLATATSTITFAGIPNTYKHLQVRYMTLTGTATNDLRMRFNSDTGSNYVWHQLQGNGSSAAAAANLSQTRIAVGMVGGTANPGVGIVDTLDYANTSKYKTTRSLAGIDQNGSGVMMFWSGLWQNTSAINSITFDSASGNFNQYSQFSLYGVR
jgi:hypothetical protein